MEEEKKKKKRKYLLLLLLLLLIGGVITFVLLRNNEEAVSFVKGYSDRTLSSNSKEIDTSFKKKKEEDYTEIFGFGEVTIDSENPNIKLINPSSNKDYLCFDVFYNDELLYSSSLIEPGRMEEFAILKVLDAGRHTLKYQISSYNPITKETMLSGIVQEQNINIKK